MIPTGPAGLGTSAARIGEALYRVPARRQTSHEDALGLCGPGAVRDDPALGEVVNDRLVGWAEQVGIYPGQLNRVRAANFGRLMMLAHPDCDDPRRAARRGVGARWPSGPRTITTSTTRALAPTRACSPPGGARRRGG
jgi:2-methylisoborneol synthase